MASSINLNRKFVTITAVILLVAFTLGQISDSNNNIEFENNLTPSPYETYDLAPTVTPSPAVDTTPPIIYSSLLECLYVDKENFGDEEIVCIDDGNWQGRGDVISIPITGQVYGTVKRITVNDKDITWNNSGEIYTRLDLKIALGLNRFLVKAYDSDGNVSEKYLDIISGEVNEEIDLNINE